MFSRTILISAADCIAMFIAAMGCATVPRESPQADREALSLLMPGRIRIVEPFTRVRAAGSASKPDNIELLIQAVSVMNDPGMMIVGQVRVELYEYTPSSADPKARRLEQWDIDLTTVRQQRAHWNPMTQMYEFRLGVDPARIPPADRYVLAVTYHSPLGDRLTDESVLKLQPRAYAPPGR